MRIIVIDNDNDVAGSIRYQIVSQNNGDGYCCKTYIQAKKIIDKSVIDVVYVNNTERLISQRIRRLLAKKKHGSVILYGTPENVMLNEGKWSYWNNAIEDWIYKIYKLYQSYKIQKIYQIPFHFAIYLILRLLNIGIVSMITHRVGHLCINNYMWMAEQDKHKWIGVYDITASDQLLKMIKRAKFLAVTNNKKWHKVLLNPILCHSTLYQSTNNYRDIDKPLWKSASRDKVFLKWTQEEEVKGNALLEKYGIAEKDWYICFHNRDSRYLSETHTYVPSEHWKYHDYRDSKIENYILAAQWVVEQGGYAFRVGMLHEQRLIDTGRIIDYTSTGDDFGNIYLLSHCKFQLGTGDGVAQISSVFGVPIALANYPLLEYITTMRDGDLYIPKLLWWNHQQRYLTLDEWLTQGMGRLQRAEEYDKHDLAPIENTAEEILELCQEMNQKIDGTWQEQEGDRELIEKYKAIMNDPKFWCSGCPAMMATTFLRRHKDVLF